MIPPSFSMLSILPISTLIPNHSSQLSPISTCPHFLSYLLGISRLWWVSPSCFLDSSTPSTSSPPFWELHAGNTFGEDCLYPTLPFAHLSSKSWFLVLHEYSKCGTSCSLAHSHTKGEEDFGIGGRDWILGSFNWKNKENPDEWKASLSCFLIKEGLEIQDRFLVFLLAPFPLLAPFHLKPKSSSSIRCELRASCADPILP